jgi:predicted cation transporter
MISPLTTAGLSALLLAVLVLPFAFRQIEHNLEGFLFVMGVGAVTVSRSWSGEIVQAALLDPIRLKHPIVEAVLVAGIVFRVFRDRIRGGVLGWERILGRRVFLFAVVVGLGLLSSVITAIIAALVLAEVVTGLKMEKKAETHLVVITCFSIGLGAALTPVGEPLATIAIAKLAGEPYHAGFWFLLKVLGLLVVPGVVALGVIAMFLEGKEGEGVPSLSEDRPETMNDVFARAGKVYLFVMALTLLGEGFKPIIDAYIIRLPPAALYWINMISAILDNATLTAAEISPRMALPQIRSVLMGLLIAGGMLIPGNIPNIIAAGKLKIGSREWARVGMPLGLAMMAIAFVFLMFV